MALVDGERCAGWRSMHAVTEHDWLDGMETMACLQWRLWGVPREHNAGCMCMPSACFFLCGHYLRKMQSFDLPQAFWMTHMFSKWHQPPQKHMTNHQAGSMYSWSRILFITLTSVSISKSILKTCENRRGITWERQRGFGYTKRKETKQSHRSWSKWDIHTDEDGRMKVSSLGSMQHGYQTPQSHSSRQYISQYKCSTHVRQSWTECWLAHSFWSCCLHLQSAEGSRQVCSTSASLPGAGDGNQGSQHLVSTTRWAKLAFW